MPTTASIAKPVVRSASPPVIHYALHLLHAPTSRPQSDQVELNSLRVHLHVVFLDKFGRRPKQVLLLAHLPRLPPNHRPLPPPIQLHKLPLFTPHEARKVQINAIVCARSGRLAGSAGCGVGCG